MFLPCSWTSCSCRGLGSSHTQGANPGGQPLGGGFPSNPPQMAPLILGLLGFASELITVSVIFFHAIISHDHRFFSEVPRIEESQDPGSSPRREEVGRRTLGAYGGFLLPFFYRARFQLFTLLFSSVSKTITQKPPNTLGILESTSPRRALHD